jgi:hypothetical protein
VATGGDVPTRRGEGKGGEVRQKGEERGEVRQIGGEGSGEGRGGLEKGQRFDEVWPCGSWTSRGCIYIYIHYIDISI